MIGISANANHSIAYSRWFTGSGGGGCGSAGAFPVGFGLDRLGLDPDRTERVGERAPDGGEVDARHREPAVGEMVDGVAAATAGSSVWTSPCTTAMPPGGGSVVDAAGRRGLHPAPVDEHRGPVGEAERGEHVDPDRVVAHLVAEHRLVGRVEGAAGLDPGCRRPCPALTVETSGAGLA